MRDVSELLDAIMTATAAPTGPPWAETATRLPDGRTAHYAELPCAPVTTVAVHQLAGTPPTVVLELTPTTPPHHLTPAEAHSLSHALAAAARLAR